MDQDYFCDHNATHTITHTIIFLLLVSSPGPDCYHCLHCYLSSPIFISCYEQSSRLRVFRSKKSPHFSLLSSTSPCELPEREVISAYNLKAVRALYETTKLYLKEKIIGMFLGWYHIK
jgi:hypothetical protein